MSESNERHTKTFTDTNSDISNETAAYFEEHSYPQYNNTNNNFKSQYEDSEALKKSEDDKIVENKEEEKYIQKPEFRIKTAAQNTPPPYFINQDTLDDNPVTNKIVESYKPACNDKSLFSEKVSPPAFFSDSNDTMINKSPETPKQINSKTNREEHSNPSLAFKKDSSDENNSFIRKDVIQNNELVRLLPGSLIDVNKFQYSQHVLQFISPFVSKDSCMSLCPHVGYVRLNWLEDCTGLTSEKIPVCSKCGWLINKFTKIETRLNGFTWKCPSCLTENTSVNLNTPKEGTTLEDIGFDSSENQKVKILLCVDTSYSMIASIETERDPKTKCMNYICEAGKVISFLDRVKASIYKLLDNILKEKPNAIVGIMEFASVLKIYGDCTRNAEKIPYESSIYESSEKLMFTAKSCITHKMNEPIHKTYYKLIKKIASLEPEVSAQTALGPCLIVTKHLMENARIGSQILIFTDGMADRGCGKFIDEKNGKLEDEMFYDYLADFYKNKGIAVSIHGYGKNDCCFKKINCLASKTQGLSRKYADLMIVPEIVVPYYKEDIDNIKFDIQSSIGLIVQPLHNKKSADQDQKFSRGRKGIGSYPYYFFKYLINPKIKIEPQIQPFYIQMRISFRNGGKIYRRTATEKLELVNEQVYVDFKEYDILLRYIVKVADYAIKNKTDKTVKEQAIKILDEILKILDNSTGDKLRKFSHREKICGYRNDIEKGNASDQYYSQVSKDITCEIDN